MRYKLTRIGHRPGVSYAQYDGGCSADTCLRKCFEFCSGENKARLETFIAGRAGQIQFDFEDCTVAVERVDE